MKTIPDGIVGYRIFRLHHDKSPNYFGLGSLGHKLTDTSSSPPYLASLFMHSVWQPGVNQAECKGKTNFLFTNQSHTRYCKSVPGQDCNCGLQAYFRLGDKLILSPNFFEDYIFAAVLGGGNVLLHPDGFRSEKAAVIGLLRNPNDLGDDILKTHEEVARKYNVPLLENRDDLIELANDTGVNITKPTDLNGLDFNKEEKKIFKENKLVNSGATNEAYGLGCISELVLLNHLAGEKLITRHLDPGHEQAKIIKLIDQASLEMKKELTGFNKIIFNLFFKQTLLSIGLTFLFWLMAMIGFGFGVELAFKNLGVNIPVFGLLLLTTLTFPIFVVVVFEKADNYLRKKAVRPAVDKLGT